MLSADEVTTRVSYNQLASLYSDTFRDLSAETSEDRALIEEFASRVGGSGPVLDVGCGTGRVAAHLRHRGLVCLGLDISDGMLAEARQLHVDLPLAVGTLTRLPIAAAAASGLLAWYSIIHTAPEDLPQAFAEFARVLSDGAPVLLAFQGGSGERLDRTTAFGRHVHRTNYRHRVDLIAELLCRQGVIVQKSVVRDPVADHEMTRQAFILGVRRTGE